MAVEETTLPTTLTTEDEIPSSPGCSKGYQIYYTAVTFGIFLVGIFGLVSNSLTVLIFAKSRKIKNNTTFLLSTLAKVDGLVCLSYLPPGITRIFAQFATRALYTAVLTNVTYTLNQISISITTILVWQRYLSVCHPHSAKTWCEYKRLRLMVIGAVALAIPLYLPFFFKNTLKYDENGTLQAPLTDLGKNKIFYYAYTLVFIHLVTFVMPMMIIIYATVRLIRSLQQMESTISESSSKAKRELTISVVVIVVLFIVLQFTRIVRTVLENVYTPYGQALACGGRLQYWGAVPHFTLLTNCSTNFLVFVVCAKGFRRELLRIVCGIENNAVGNNSSTVSTNVSERPTADRIGTN